MKKLMTLMLGLSLITGTVAVVYGQDTSTTKTKKAKKAKKAPPEGHHQDGLKALSGYESLGSRVAPCSLRGNPATAVYSPQFAPFPPALTPGSLRRVTFRNGPAPLLVFTFYML